jgi:hypothetical protein
MPDQHMEAISATELADFAAHFGSYVRERWSLPAAHNFQRRLCTACNTTSSPPQASLEIPDWIKGLTRQEVLIVCDGLLAQVRAIGGPGRSVDAPSNIWANRSATMRGWIALAARPYPERAVRRLPQVNRALELLYSEEEAPLTPNAMQQQAVRSLHRHTLVTSRPATLCSQHAR